MCPHPHFNYKTQLDFTLRPAFRNKSVMICGRFGFFIKLRILAGIISESSCDLLNSFRTVLTSISENSSSNVTVPLSRIFLASPKVPVATKARPAE